VKNIFPSVNPSFDTVTFTAEMTKINLQKAENDGITLTINNRRLNNALGQRWLFYYKTKICDQNTLINLDDYKELLHFSL